MSEKKSTDFNSLQPLDAFNMATKWATMKPVGLAGAILNRFGKTWLANNPQAAPLPEALAPRQNSFLARPTVSYGIWNTR